MYYYNRNNFHRKAKTDQRLSIILQTALVSFNVSNWKQAIQRKSLAAPMLCINDQIYNFIEFY